MRKESDTAQIHLNKIAVAKRQLGTAIRMTLREEDDLAIHTLGAAAYRILRDLNQQRGRNELTDIFSHALFGMAQEIASGRTDGMPKPISESAYAVGLIHEVVAKIKAAEVKSADDLNVSISMAQQLAHWRKFNGPANFLKHADFDSEKSLSLDTLDNDMLLMSACASYVKLMGTHTPETEIYVLYRFGDDPEWRGSEIAESKAGVRFRKLPPEKRREYCLKVLEKTLKTMATKYSRGSQYSYVRDFELPWTEHFPV